MISTFYTCLPSVLPKRMYSQILATSDLAGWYKSDVRPVHPRQHTLNQPLAGPCFSEVERHLHSHVSRYPSVTCRSPSIVTSIPRNERRSHRAPPFFVARTDKGFKRILRNAVSRSLLYLL